MCQKSKRCCHPNLSALKVARLDQLFILLKEIFTPRRSLFGVIPMHIMSEMVPSRTLEQLINNFCLYIQNILT